MKRSLVGIATALLWTLAAHAQPTPQSFPVPGHGVLQLPVAKDWRAASKSLEQPASVLLRVRPATGDAFLVQVTALWLDAEKLARKTPEQLKRDVAKSGEGPMQQAEEKALRLEELRGAQAFGYYYSLTDRAPGPGEYKYLTQGILLAGEMLTIFTILQREPASAEKAQLLQMLAGAAHSKAASGR